MLPTGRFIRFAATAAFFALATAAAQTAAPAARAAGSPLSLHALVREALRANPGIRAAAEAAAALRAAAPAAGTLPDPEVSAGWMGGFVPFAVNDGATSNRSLGVSERFPFPGKLRLQRAAAEAGANAAEWRYQAAVRRVTAEVKAAYYAYAYDHQALQITRSDRTLLAQLTRIAEARYASGKGLQPDVLKGQVELSQLLGRIEILSEQENTAAARINTLLDRDAAAALAPPAPLRQAKLAYTLPQLQALAARRDSGLGAADALLALDRNRLQLARKAYDPDFSVSYGVERMAAPAMTMAAASVSVNIPLFYRSKQRPQLRAAAAALGAQQAARDDRRATVDYRVREQYLAARQANQLAVLYARAIVPQASQTLQSAELAYQAGTADFLTLLDDFSTVLDYQVNYYRQVAAYNTALAKLEPLVGKGLTQ